MHWFEKTADQGHAEASREFKRTNDLTGWFMLAFGIIALPFSIAGFFRPHIFAKNRSLFAARYIGAPLAFLMGIVMIIEGIRSLG